MFGRKPVEIAVCEQMSDVVEPGLEALDRQNRFVSEHLRRIFVQIYRIVDNVADAQDLTQETFIKALQHQEQLKDEQKAAHWLSRIATNTAIDFMRRNSRATLALASVLALMVTGLMLEGPAPSMASSNEPMVQATVNGIQSRSGDQAFGLMHSGARSVTYTVGAQGTLGARYTDPETGNVTMTKVYVE